jgi:hypothetical protein
LIGLEAGGKPGQIFRRGPCYKGAVGKETWTIAETSERGAKGLFLLFAQGKRPDRAAIREFVACQRAVSLTHDLLKDTPLHLVAADGEPVARGGAASPQLDDCLWLELLRDGLAFDLCGIAPGKPVAFPAIEHRFDLAEVPRGPLFETLQLKPGHHLAGGERTLPVAKGLVALARDLVHHFPELVAVVWPPSASAIGRRFFESVTTAWIDGGAFPALGLTAFRESIDGALQSVGLDFWIGQELRIEQPLSVDKLAATRLGVRLINQLVLVGGIDDSERIIAPDGTRLVLRPSRNGRYIRVWRE